MVPTNRAVNHPQPDVNRLSILSAVIILAYLLTHFIDLPPRDFSIQLPGVYLSIQVNISLIVTILVAALTAVGADWLLYDHPDLQGRAILPHCLLPSLTALVIGIPLYQLPFGAGWWGALLIGSLLLMLVLVAEYVSASAEDFRRRMASAGLTAVSFALFLILAIGLRSIGTRLFFTLPTLAIGASLVSLRVLHLRLHGQWLVYEALLIGFITAQVAAPFYYWPFNPVAFGIPVLGAVFILVSLFTGLIEDKPLRSVRLELMLVILIVIGATFWLNS